jgi:HSP20 family protein
MAIQRYGSGFEDMMPQSFSTMLDKFFNESVNSRERLNKFNPHVDTCETENGYEIDVSLPGLKKDDIQLDFQQGRLTISGERQFSNEKKEKRYHMIESQYGAFSRSFQLPDTVNPERIEATFEDGILHVTVPKDERKTTRHRIEVRGGNAQARQLDKNSDQKGMAGGNGESKAEASGKEKVKASGK